MASDKEYLDYVMEQLSDLDGISFRSMMGEYILYYKGKIIGGIYDNRFLLKPVKSALELMPGATFEIPYNNGKPMLLAENIDDKFLITGVIEAMYDELPEIKRKKQY